MKRIVLSFVAMVCALWAVGKEYTLTSPNQRLAVAVEVGTAVNYSVSLDGNPLILPSPIALQLEGGVVWGQNSHLKQAKTTSVNSKIEAHFYKKAVVDDVYNQLELQFKENFKILFRAYDEGVAYRFVSTGKKDFIVKNEQATFTFSSDWPAYVSYANAGGSIDQQVRCSFENTYVHKPLTQFEDQKIAFLPLLVEADNYVKVAITEADLEDYPGMFLRNADHSKTLTGFYAKYPLKEEGGGHNNLQYNILERADYLAPCKAGKSLPWRIVNVSSNDGELLNNDMVYRLASPSRVEDISWVKPGKVAWDWWNDWGLYNVDFKAGINTKTYKYYIDFASARGIEYVILDEGWATSGKADLFSVVPTIDLKEIVDYGKEKNVGIILWAGHHAFNRDMEKVCAHYSELGVKGFKVDFMDRDDAVGVNFHYRAAAMAAKYHLVLDFHGTYKPTGLNRTYPNVLNFEGVAGQEQTKWSTIQSYDQVRNDLIIPFTRMLAGPMDYTQGAMLNGTKQSYVVSYSNPMSQGTRCRQLAEYVVFFSPLNMLCDSPTHYEENPECTEFIASIPTVWDETVPVLNVVGKYVAVARRSGDVWYVGGICGWDVNNFPLIELSFLPKGEYEIDLFCDGLNAHRFAQDYRKTHFTFSGEPKFVHFAAPGGGFAMKITRK